MLLAIGSVWLNFVCTKYIFKTQVISKLAGFNALIIKSCFTLLFSPSLIYFLLIVTFISNNFPNNYLLHFIFEQFCKQ